MLDKIKQIFGGPSATVDEKNADEERRLAAAALMIEAASADANYAAKERAIITQALASQFSLSQEAAGRLAEEAESAVQAANDLHRFTKHAKQFSDAEKTTLVETLWRIILSDDVRDPYEDAFMRRLCGLIYVSDVASGEARQRALAAGGGNALDKDN
ncbi:MAG: TerB family tellurite resistance protein [Pseudomonadota bacterium]